jgi:hypothetical protein
MRRRQIKKMKRKKMRNRSMKWKRGGEIGGGKVT